MLAETVPARPSSRKSTLNRFGLLCFSVSIMFVSLPAAACTTFIFSYPPANSCIAGLARTGGDHQCKGGEFVWILLNEGGNFYIQDPSATIEINNSWHQDKISVGPDIKRIYAISVDKIGNDFFQEKVDNGDFGAIRKNKLPQNHTMLASLPINTLPSC